MILANSQDVSARLGRALEDEAETARVEAFLEDASALIVDYCTGSWDRTSPPAVFKTVACAEVIRWLAVSPGTVLEKTGELEVQYAQTAANPGLSQAAKDALRRYRKHVSALPLREDTWPSSTTG
ncbi:hypothetical protein ACFWOT_09220 [Streptomyces sp. NPDC058440]|uniref:hypothetical protein n=1 Tax=Streptomyces sp. NPDC058440 TaxID=3346501 RepID=UPI00364B6B23